MPRRTKPPASPRRAYWRAKARRESIALAAERRAEDALVAKAKRKAAHAARIARERQVIETEQRYYEAMNRPAAPVTPVSARIQGRAEMAEQARWRAAGIEV